MSIKNILLSLDIYTRPPTLLINKRASLQTYPGSLFTILTMAIFVYLFSSSDFFQKLNPKVLSQPFTFESTPTIHLTKQSFPIFIRIADISGKAINDPSIFQINIDLQRFVKNYNLETPKFEKVEEKRIGIRNCIETDFPKFLNLQKKELKAVVPKLNLTCLNDEDLSIKGDFEENEVIQLLATVSHCQNETSNNSCKSQEEIKAFFDETPKTLSLTYVSFNEDVEKFENPILANLKFLSYNIANGVQIQNLMTLKQSFFKTNSGISDENLIVSIKLDELLKGDFQILDPKPTALFYLALQVSRKYEKITRTYQNLGEALASAMSLVNVFRALIKIIMAYFHNILYKLEIVNKLYKFDQTDDKEKVNAPNQNKKKDSFNAKNKFYRKDQLNISIWRAFMTDIKKLFRKKTNNEEKLYLKTEGILKRDTNLPFILKKLHEIEKIKLLLFDKSQIFLFNFLSKPCLFLPGKDELDFSKKIEETLELSDELNDCSQTNSGIYERQLKENIKAIIDSNTKIDRKLLLLLDQSNCFEMKKEDSFLEIPEEKL